VGRRDTHITLPRQPVAGAAGVSGTVQRASPIVQSCHRAGSPADAPETSPARDARSPERRAQPPPWRGPGAVYAASVILASFPCPPSPRRSPPRCQPSRPSRRGSSTPAAAGAVWGVGHVHSADTAAPLSAAFHVSSVPQRLLMLLCASNQAWPTPHRLLPRCLRGVGARCAVRPRRRTAGRRSGADMGRRAATATARSKARNDLQHFGSPPTMPTACRKSALARNLARTLEAAQSAQHGIDGEPLDQARGRR
jgi:hypothetical protein